MKIGHLALRQEGSLVVAYYVESNNMDDSIFIGSIQMAAIHDNEDVKQAFINTMRLSISKIIKLATGEDIELGDPEPAPEYEQSGNA